MWWSFFIILIKESVIFDTSGCVRYYSLARYSLVDALRLAGAVAGSSVLLPKYLCRDILASLHQIGAKPIWYEISENLTPLNSQKEWPIADIVLAVNYFGFPQNLHPYKEYSVRTGAVIIEDNAHGYLSRDETGQLLGCRTNLGIFSIRKTLRLPDGAALWIKTGVYQNKLPSQAPFNGKGFLQAQIIKAKLRSAPFIGENLFGVSIALNRWIRKKWNKNGVLHREPGSEKTIPGSPEPWKFLLSNLTNFSASKEIEQRRKAYIKCADEADRVGAISIFKSLPVNISPYGFAFRGDDVAINEMKKFANARQYEMVKWPDLPDDIIKDAPSYYLDIYLINFMH